MKRVFERADADWGEVDWTERGGDDQGVRSIPSRAADRSDAGRLAAASVILQRFLPRNVGVAGG